MHKVGTRIWSNLTSAKGVNMVGKGVQQLFRINMTDKLFLYIIYIF